MADRVPMAEVTEDFFRILGVNPQLGRDFRSEDTNASAPLVVMLTDGAWRRRFGGDRGILRRTLTLSGQTAELIGVLQRIYDKHIKSADAQSELRELIGLIKSGNRIALLCYCRDPKTCHRSRIVSNVKKKMAVKVTDLIPPLF